MLKEQPFIFQRLLFEDLQLQIFFIFEANLKFVALYLKIKNTIVIEFQKGQQNIVAT